MRFNHIPIVAMIPGSHSQFTGNTQIAMDYWGFRCIDIPPATPAISGYAVSTGFIEVEGEPLHITPTAICKRPVY